MTDEPQRIADATMDAAVARRAPGHADAALLADVMQAAIATRQVRRWPRFRGGPNRRVVVAFAAVAIAGATLFAASGGGSHVTVSPRPSAAAVLPALADSPLPSLPTDCATDTASILLGAAMPATATAPMTLPHEGGGGGSLTGVYVTKRDNEAFPNVWAVRSGATSATRIATVSGNEWISASVSDISADGRFALLDVGEFHGGIPRPTCEDLWLVATDGSLAHRLTINHAGQSAIGGRFSADGRLVAYREDAPDGGVFSLTYVDLVNAEGFTAGCVGDSQSFGYDWSPVGEQIVAQCGQQITVFVRNVATATINVPFNLSDEVSDFVAWRDATHVLLVSAQGGTTINAPIRSRLLTWDASNVAGPKGTWADPVIVQPALGDDGPGGVAAPAGDRYVMPATTGTPDAEGWYVMDDVTGQATKVSGPADHAAWSADGQYVLLDEWGPQAEILMLHDLATGTARSLGTLSPDNARGVWRLQ